MKWTLCAALLLAAACARVAAEETATAQCNAVFPPVVPPPNALDASAVAPLVAWMESHGAVISADISITVGNEGRGLQLEQALPAQAPLLSLPERVTLCASSALQHSAAAPALARLSQSQQLETIGGSPGLLHSSASVLSEAQVILTAAFERFVAKEASPWAAWLPFWPERTTSALSWPADVAAQLDAGVHFAAALRSDMLTWEASLSAELQQVMQASPDVFPPATQAQWGAWLRWAAAFVTTHASYLQDGPHLLPFLHLANGAAANDDAVISLQHVAGMYEAVAAAGLPAGAALRMHYSTGCNVNLLIRHGFTLDAPTHDCLQLGCSDKPSEDSAELSSGRTVVRSSVVALAKQAGWLGNSMLSGEQPLPEPLLNCQRILSLQPYDYARLARFVAKPGVLSIRNERTAVSAVLHSIDAMSAALLPAADDVWRFHNSPSPAERQAARVRVGQQRLLTALRDALLQHWQSLLDDMSLDVSVL
eukprot:PLAT15032.1.p1 GENE.PLAT15032.1~~PLAT15032.1.p1  ORF type:complete len:481 (+),score=199.08 PLAT15032.1:302-1744(+)